MFEVLLVTPLGSIPCRLARYLAGCLSHLQLARGLRRSPSYLHFKLFHLYSFKKCMYIHTKARGLRRSPSYLHFKLFHLYSFKKCMYIHTKTYIRILSSIFLKISGRAAALEPLWMTHT